MLTVCVAATEPGIDVAWLFGSGLNGMLNLFGVDVENAAVRLVKSTPVLPYWFDSQTYGVRPANRPMPPRTCRCFVPLPLRSQLKPARGENIVGVGTTSVA